MDSIFQNIKEDKGLSSDNLNTDITVNESIEIKDKINNKIDSFINYIISKPVSEMNREDYNILASERDHLQLKEQQATNAKRMAELMATTICGCATT